MDQSVDKKPRLNFTDFLRVRFKGILDPIGGFLNRIGLTPNMITLLGLIGHLAAAVLLAAGYLTWGGVVILIMAPFDALDGTMARLRGQPTRFGGFLDSVTDRFSEIIILGGLMLYYLNQGQILPVILGYLAAAGSIMVSYIRARGESAGYVVKNGLMTRVERYIVLVPCLLFQRPEIALWILAVLTNFTAVQRIWIVARQAQQQHDILNK